MSFFHWLLSSIFGVEQGKPTCRETDYCCSYQNPLCTSGHCNFHCRIYCKCGAGDKPKNEAEELAALYNQAEDYDDN